MTTMDKGSWLCEMSCGRRAAFKVIGKFLKYSCGNHLAAAVRACADGDVVRVVPLKAGA